CDRFCAYRSLHSFPTRRSSDLVLGCDMVVVNDYWALSKLRAGRSQVVLNSYEAMPGSFTTRPDMQFPATDIVSAVRRALGEATADRKSTRLNSSHVKISYAVFC